MKDSPRQTSNAKNRGKDKTENCTNLNKFAGTQVKSKHDAKNNHQEHEKSRCGNEDKVRKKKANRDPQKDHEDIREQNSVLDISTKDSKKRLKHDVPGHGNYEKSDTSVDGEKDLKKTRMRDKSEPHKNVQKIDQDYKTLIGNQGTIRDNNVEVNKSGAKPKKHDIKTKPGEKDGKEAHQKSTNKESATKPVISEISDEQDKNVERQHKEKLKFKTRDSSEVLSSTKQTISSPNGKSPDIELQSAPNKELKGNDSWRSTSSTEFKQPMERLNTESTKDKPLTTSNDANTLNMSERKGDPQTKEKLLQFDDARQMAQNISEIKQNSETKRSSRKEKAKENNTGPVNSDIRSYFAAEATSETTSEKFDKTSKTSVVLNKSSKTPSNQERKSKLLLETKATTNYDKSTTDNSTANKTSTRKSRTPYQSKLLNEEVNNSKEDEKASEYEDGKISVEENKDSSDLTRMKVSRTSTNLYKKQDTGRSTLQKGVGDQNHVFASDDSDGQNTDEFFLTIPPHGQSDEDDNDTRQEKGFNKKTASRGRHPTLEHTAGLENLHATDTEDRMEAKCKSKSKSAFPWKDYSKVTGRDKRVGDKPWHLQTKKNTNQPRTRMADPIGFTSKGQRKKILKSQSRPYVFPTPSDVSDDDTSSVEEDDTNESWYNNIPTEVERNAPFAVEPFLTNEEDDEELSKDEDGPIFNQASLTSFPYIRNLIPTKSGQSHFKIKPRYTKGNKEVDKQRKPNKFKVKRKTVKMTKQHRGNLSHQMDIEVDESDRDGYQGFLSNEESDHETVKTPSRPGILKSSKNNRGNKRPRGKQQPQAPEHRMSKIPGQRKSRMAENVFSGDLDYSDEDPQRVNLKKYKTSVSFRTKPAALDARVMGKSHYHSRSRERDYSMESSEDNRDIHRQAREYSKQSTKSTIRIPPSRISRYARITSGSSPSDEDSDDPTQQYSKQRTKSTTRIRTARSSTTSPKSKSHVKSLSVADNPHFKKLMSLLDAAKEHLVQSSMINNNKASIDKNNDETNTMDGILVSGGEEPLDPNSLTLLKKSISSTNLKKRAKESNDDENGVSIGPRHSAKKTSGEEFHVTGDYEVARASSAKVMGEKSVTPRGSTKHNITPDIQNTRPEADSRLRVGSSPPFSRQTSELEREPITVESLKNGIKYVLPSLSQKDLELVADQLIAMGIETSRDLTYIEREDLEKTRLNPIQTRKLLSRWKLNTTAGRRSIAGSAVELPTETDHLPAEELIDKNKWLKFNVGGVMMETTRKTIDRLQSSFLALLLDTDSEDVDPPPDGIYRIDRNPQAFQVLLDYARYGKMIGNPDDLGEEFLLEEIEYYGMDGEVVKCVTDYFDAKRNVLCASGIQVEKISITEMALKKQYKHHNSYGITNTMNIACYTSVPGGKGSCQADVQPLFLYETAYLRFPALFRAPCLRCGHIVCFADDSLIGAEGWCHKCRLCLRCQDILCDELSDDEDLRFQQQASQDAIVRKTAKVVFLHNPGTPSETYDFPSPRSSKLALVPYQGGREKDGGKGGTPKFQLPKLPNVMDVPMHSVRANMYKKSNTGHPMSHSFSDFGKW